MRYAFVYYENIRAGILRETDDGFVFQYDEGYVLNETTKPISLTLPKTTEAYSSNILFSFFDGLIPEGWLLELLIKQYSFDLRDRFGILLKTGEDVIGAVSVKEGQ